MNKSAVVLMSLLCVPTAGFARTFKSTLPLKVYANASNEQPAAYLGATSAKSSRGVPVPSSDDWHVRPVGALGPETLSHLAKGLKAQRVPGLDLSNRWDLTDASLVMLEGIASLRTLYLSQTKVGERGLVSISTLTGLRSLTLNNQTTDVGVMHLAGLSALMALDLSGSRVSDNGLSVLKMFPDLQTLNLSGTGISDLSASVLAACRSLVQLDLSGTALTDKAMGSLASLPRLEKLRASPRLANAGLKSLAASGSLKKLDLTGTAITNPGLNALTQVSSLEELVLAGTRVGDAGMVHVARMKNLKTLDLSETGVTPAGVAQLSRMARLETVVLPWEHLGEPEIRALAQLRNLKQALVGGRVVTLAFLARMQMFSKPVLARPENEPAAAVFTPSLSKAPDRPAVAAAASLPLWRGKERVRAALQVAPTPDLLPANPAPSAIAIDALTGPAIRMEVNAGAPPADATKTAIVAAAALEPVLAFTSPDLALTTGESHYIGYRNDRPLMGLGEIRP